MSGWLLVAAGLGLFVAFLGVVLVLAAFDRDEPDVWEADETGRRVK